MTLLKFLINIQECLKILGDFDEKLPGMHQTEVDNNEANFWFVKNVSPVSHPSHGWAEK